MPVSSLFRIHITRSSFILLPFFLTLYIQVIDRKTFKTASVFLSYISKLLTVMGQWRGWGRRRDWNPLHWNHDKRVRLGIDEDKQMTVGVQRIQGKIGGFFMCFLYFFLFLILLSMSLVILCRLDAVLVGSRVLSLVLALLCLVCI